MPNNNVIEKWMYICFLLVKEFLSVHLVFCVGLELIVLVVLVIYLLIIRNGFVVKICPVFLPCDQMLPSACGSTFL